ncbi:sigma-70 family RNA polymerase sigma factor [Desulfitobacterium sp. AusDCA]
MAIDKGFNPFIYEIRQIKPPQNREWQNLMLQAKSDNLFANQRIFKMYFRLYILANLVFKINLTRNGHNIKSKSLSRWENNASFI